MSEEAQGMFKLPKEGEITVPEAPVEDTPPIFKLPEEFIIKPNQSVKKLETLRFDPITKLVDLHDRITNQINNMMWDADGEPQKYSQVAVATLLTIQSKVSADLLRYGYSRVSETTVIEQTNHRPMQIVLTRPDKES